MFAEAKQIKQEDIRVNPRKLLIVKHPKVGGTHALMELENNLIIDLENGTGFYAGKAKVYNIKEEWTKFNASADKQISLASYTYRYLKHLKELSKDGPICKYLTLDTATQLELVANMVATAKYKKTLMGKSFTDDDITLLPRGAGYGHLRNAFKMLYQMLEGIYSDCLIIVAHPKDSSINVDGKEIQASDINLTGRLKQIVTSDMDAMGVMYRKKNSNINILSFKTHQNDLITGARCPHLKNQDFEFSELLDNGELTVQWEKIFI